jgi:competence ComEA-like helix-hairpin-helix protein
VVNARRVALSLIAACAIATVASAAPSQAVRVNVNTASVAQFAFLPGVGPAIAQRIADSRSQAGPFVVAADLGRVKGIGAKKLAAMLPFVCVDAACVTTATVKIRVARPEQGKAVQP